ncbi:hypothetical protein HUU42_07320 [bacterium]|nr:hypothetical protein [bacterium]
MIKKLILHSAIVLNLIALAYAILLFFPQPLFSNEIKIKNFQIYSHQPIPLEKIIDDVYEQLRKIDGFDENDTYTIFFCDSYLEYLMLHPIGPNSFGYTSSFTNYIILSVADWNEETIVARNSLSRKIQTVLTHEIGHVLIDKKFGKIKSLSIPKWKEEGYCDFISKDSSFDVKKGIELLKSNQRIDSYSFKYFEYRLCVTYLLEVENLNIETLVEREHDFEVVRAKALDAVITQKLKL